MTINKVKNAIEPTQEALKKLNEALGLLHRQPGKRERSVLEDGTVKRFETLFEYCWKMLKIAVEFQGGEAPGPRPAIQEAIRFGWIKDVELWMLALDTRNATVHDYFDAAPKNYIEIIEKFSKEVGMILNTISALRPK